MSELRVGTWRMPAGEVGPESPLPPLGQGRDPHGALKAADMPDEQRQRLLFGRVRSPLPYAMQDQYTQDLRDRDLLAVTLENERLRATFLPELGGRLWSLVDKTAGRELLSVNPVFKPVNIALRGAWFSGGVEWNIGTIGHSPFTCSPIFAGVLHAPGGMPVLRMYEWERIRGVPFQIDAVLPDGSPVLLIRVRITNPHDVTIPMYWWSNAAVPEEERTRVLVPADSAWRFAYSGGLQRVPIPWLDGVDVSYPRHGPRSTDYFFHIPEDTDPWEVAVGGDGYGMALASTRRLIGRKLFLWGMGAGGRRWQDYLSEGGATYIETQAGLARTQAEHLPMPAGAKWSWTEGYGPVSLDPGEAHDTDWSRATAAAGRAVEQLIPPSELARWQQAGCAWEDTPPEEMIQTGSGWGALEELLHGQSRAPAPLSPATPFPAETMDDDQFAWRGLLTRGALPPRDPQAKPGGFLVQRDWQDLLEASLAGGKSDHWLAWFHAGVMRYYHGDPAGAGQAWETSVARADNAWARRNLAVLAARAGDESGAADAYARAALLAPACLPLLIEAGKAMIPAGRAADWLALARGLPAEKQDHGRIRLLRAEAALALGDFDTCRRILSQPLVVADLREGERTLTDLWFDLHARQIARAEGLAVDDALRARVHRAHPAPAHLDYRMHDAT